MFSRKLSDKKIEKIYADAAEAAQNNDDETTLKTLQPLIKAQAQNSNAADALLDFIRKNHIVEEDAFEILENIFDAHQENAEILTTLAISLESVSNMNDLNGPPPENPIFKRVATKLTEFALSLKDTEQEADIVEALSSLCRLMGHAYSPQAEKHYARLVELLPDKAWTHYNQGLFFKTAGRFAEGLKANKTALELYEGEEPEPYLWNLGICATGAKEGEEALKIWQDIGNKIEMGRFDLPDGKYPSCKVRLAEHPRAERTPDNDTPGGEETIWIERLSPCHGIIRSVLYYDIGVDYGDVILFDGAPITTHKYGDQDIPVFPHLATLIKSKYHFYDFAATQENAGDINSLDKNCENDVVIYSHTENFKILCASCWKDEDIDHADHSETEEHHVVTGRIAAPPDVTPAQVLKQIDDILKDTPQNRIFAPDLCIAAGIDDRAQIESRRYDALINA